MKYKYSLAILLLMSTLTFAQVGIGVAQPEAALDINVQTKFSGLPDVSDRQEEYNHFLFLDQEGYVGAKVKEEGNFIYRTSYFSKMPARIVARAPNRINLNADITIEVPPYAKFLIELHYSVPVMTGTNGNLMVHVSRQINTATEAFINEASRGYSPPSAYIGTGTANGRAVANTYYDAIENPSNTPIKITYRMYGETKGTPTQFGMFAGGTGNNYNWGRGSMNINVFDY
ncbi:hypothetical protein [Myroides sp. DF42-4-2]|uniref:hypothetical protein n=1 Tax=unclassified Myroides TaxID=2642485 RepID=UPI00257856CD|nr:hypothetical protein [Myroides sp. DF42-4-2]MDM1406679.1 hypothetical protein [Myroides sp. DF42-4-2]